MVTHTCGKDESSMKILMISVGTRGDMEPFLAIGEILQERGHQLTCAFPEQFRNLALETGLGFTSLGPDYIEMLESDLGKDALGGGSAGIQQFLAMVKLASQQTTINKALVLRQHEILEKEKPDRVLFNGKAIIPILWGLERGVEPILVCPLPYIHFVKEHSHIAFNRDLGPFLNRLTYRLADFGMLQTLKISARWLGITGVIPRERIKNTLPGSRAIYTISPSLFPRPQTWREGLQVLGYHHRKRPKHWQPDNDLTAFLARQQRDRLLLVTFGSMTNPDPQGVTRIIVDILARHKIPAVINTAEGGLARLAQYDMDLIHFVDRVPYEWILPQVYGIIHHGGSGTTHLGLKFGCATLIIPHIIDQFAWNARVAALGAGPGGVRINKMTTSTLEPKILDLIDNLRYKEKAEHLARQMEEDDFREAIYQSIIEGKSRSWR